MIKRSSLSFTLFLLFCDLTLTNVALFEARKLRLAIDVGRFLGPEGRWLQFDPVLYLAVTIIWFVIFIMMSVYDSRRTLRAVADFQIVTQATMLACLVFAGVSYFFFRELSRLLFVYFFVIDLLMLFTWRGLLRLIFRAQRSRNWPRGMRRVLIVGAGEVGRQVGEVLQEHAWTGLELVGFLDDDPLKRESKRAVWPVLGTLDDVADVVQTRDIHEVVVALPLYAHQRVKDLVRALRDTRAQICIIPDYFDLTHVKTGVEEFGGLPLVSLREPAMDEFQRLTKRVVDLIVGSAGLLLATPVMLVTSVLIKLDSPGPALFRQERIGENGRHFFMYKFRSMVPNAEERAGEVIVRDEHGQLIYKRLDDPRVTRVGQLLRRTSLDELPQLLNVLKGEMSLVGPRPELPWVLEEYESWQFQRFAVPQGMTGWWQVNGRSDKPMHLHTEEDLYYIKNYSLVLDVLILWKTVGAVLMRKGAY
jgi:exopolysaccharide biosynthesis polyprenyl glycosylphosphotransferase